MVKVSSRSALAQRWPDLIDIDAGRIATGEASIEDIGWKSFLHYRSGQRPEDLGGTLEIAQRPDPFQPGTDHLINVRKP